MLTELGFVKEFEQVPRHIDIMATLHVIGNRAFSSRTKHIALRFLHIRELVKETKITAHYISTESQLTDIGTKHLNKHRLQQLLQMIKSFELGVLCSFFCFCVIQFFVSKVKICFVLYSISKVKV